MPVEKKFREKWLRVRSVVTNRWQMVFWKQDLIRGDRVGCIDHALNISVLQIFSLDIASYHFLSPDQSCSFESIIYAGVSPVGYCYSSLFFSVGREESTPTHSATARRKRTDSTETVRRLSVLSLKDSHLCVIEFLGGAFNRDHLQVTIGINQGETMRSTTMINYERC